MIIAAQPGPELRLSSGDSGEGPAAACVAGGQNWGHCTGREPKAVTDPLPPPPPSPLQQKLKPPFFFSFFWPFSEPSLMVLLLLLLLLPEPWLSLAASAAPGSYTLSLGAAGLAALPAAALPAAAPAAEPVAPGFLALPGGLPTAAAAAAAAAPLEP